MTIGDEPNLDENGSNDNKDRLNAERADENVTPAGWCWVGVRPAREAMKGAEEQVAEAECRNRRERFEIGVSMHIEWLPGEAERGKDGVT